MSDNKDINNENSIEDISIEDKSYDENKNNQKINQVIKGKQDITSDVVQKINPTNIDASKKEETTLDKNSQKINPVLKVKQDITSDVAQKINPTNIDASKKEETTLDKNKEINPKNDEPKNVPIKTKPLKEIPIEKKPFQEFINEHLIPQIMVEFEKLDKSVSEIKLENNIRPIAGDKCWFIYCSIKDTCNFWLSFDKEDISSLKSFSLCRFNEKPSVLESFLIDEKRITLKLITSRILQRLNGQKLLGVN